MPPPLGIIPTQRLLRRRRRLLQRLPAARAPYTLTPVLLYGLRRRKAAMVVVVVDEALEVLLENSDEGLVGVAVGLLLRREGEEAGLAHAADVGDLLVVVAEGEGGDLLLVGLADGVVEVEVAVAVDEDVVDAGAEQARHLQPEELREPVGREGEEAVDEEEGDQDPFQDGVEHEVREPAHLLFDEMTE